MKHLLTLGVLLCAGLSASAYDWSYTSTPPEGTVTSLEEINVTFPAFGEEVEVLRTEDVVFAYNGDAISLTKKAITNVGNTVKITLPSAVTAAGNYTLTFPQGSLNGWTTDYYDYETQPETIVLHWTIEGGQQGLLDWTATATPAEGTVTEIEAITVTFPQVYELETNDLDAITFTHDGKSVAMKARIPYGSNKLTVTPTEKQTSKGEYVLSIPAGAVLGYTDDTYEVSEGNPAVTLKWNIAAAADELDFAYTANPENGAVVGGFDKTILTFTELESVSAAADAATVKVDGTTVASTVTADGNKLHVAVVPSVESGTVTIEIPASAITGTKGAVTATATNDIKLSYTAASNVAYDLTVDFSKPAPNANGQISLEKSALNEMTFLCTTAGIVVDANATEPNVTIKQVNGDFERTATLRKGFGLNQAYSYFIAAFGSEPKQNGKYIITFKQGAFGDAAWAANHSLGHSNPELTLEFTLIDGQGEQAVEYTLEGVVTPEAGTYDNADNLKTITVTFEDETVGATDKAIATLRSTNYEETATFTKKENGVFEATFEKAPETSGTYVLSIPEAVFGNDAFINSNGEAGKTNKAFQVIYKFEGGKSIVSYELEGTITPEAGEYKDAADFRTVTITFEDKTVAVVSNSKATLAGDNFSTSARIEATDEAGVYTASFETLPDAEGEYTMTIPQGAFGDASFVTSAGELGVGSKEMTVIYTLKKENKEEPDSIESITLDNLEGRDDVYNLQGIRLSNVKNLPAGIYIVGGKKVLLRK